MTSVRCPQCRGRGEIIGSLRLFGYGIRYTCDGCGGVGYIEVRPAPRVSSIETASPEEDTDG